MINFAVDCRETVDLKLVTFTRTPGRSSAAHEGNPFLAAAAFNDVPVAIIQESSRYSLSALRELQQLVAEYKPDIVQTNSVKSHFLISLLRERPFGWLAFHHGYTAEDVKMRIYNQLDRFSLKACDLVVTVCQPFARQLETMGVRRDKIRVIPNGIAVDRFKSPAQTAANWRHRLSIPPAEPIVFTAGRLSPEKGHKYLIEAAAQMKRSGRNAPFNVLIAGSGVLEKALAEQIQAAGLQETVNLIGHQADVNALFKAADIFVLPSLSEGSPMVLLESMATQVPVIATNVGGIPEAVTNGESALLVPPANSEALGHAILALLSDRGYAQRLADTAFDRVRRDFSPDLYNSRVLSAFESTITQKQTAASKQEQVAQ